MAKIDVPGGFDVVIEERDWNCYNREFEQQIAKVVWEGHTIWEMDVTEIYVDHRDADVKEAFAKRLQNLLANPT